MRKILSILYVFIICTVSGPTPQGITRAPAYLEYVALISQNGTNAPEAIELVNTLGTEIIYHYGGVGQYTLRSADINKDIFDDSKTVVWTSDSILFEAEVTHSYPHSQIYLYASENSTLYRQAIFIRVYP